MPGITVEKHIDAPPEAVFERATDLRGAPGRISAIRRMEILTEGPVRKGTRFRETRVMFKREASEVMEIVAFDPPRGYALAVESCGCRYHTEFHFAPEGGGTRMTVRFDAVPVRPFAKMMSFLLKPMFRVCARAFEKDMDDLKQAVEREVAPSR